MGKRICHLRCTFVLDKGDDINSEPSPGFYYAEPKLVYHTPLVVSISQGAIEFKRHSHRFKLECGTNEIKTPSIRKVSY